MAASPQWLTPPFKHRCNGLAGGVLGFRAAAKGWILNPCSSCLCPVPVLPACAALHPPGRKQCAPSISLGSSWSQCRSDRESTCRGGKAGRQGRIRRSDRWGRHDKSAHLASQKSPGPGGKSQRGLRAETSTQLRVEGRKGLPSRTVCRRPPVRSTRGREEGNFATRPRTSGSACIQPASWWHSLAWPGLAPLPLSPPSPASPSKPGFVPIRPWPPWLCVDLVTPALC